MSTLLTIAVLMNAAAVLAVWLALDRRTHDLLHRVRDLEDELLP